MLHVVLKAISGHQVIWEDKKPDSPPPQLHPDCPLDTIPDHSVANALAKLFGDYPRSFVYGSHYPEVKGMAEYLDIARNQCRINLTTTHLNTETIGTCKGNALVKRIKNGMSPSTVQDKSARITIEGISYPVRSTPSLTRLWDIVGNAERYRLEKMFAAVAGEDYKLHYGLGKLLSMCRDAYRDKTCDAVRAYLEGDDLPDGIETLCPAYAKSFWQNSIAEPIKTGVVKTTGTDGKVEPGQAFRLDQRAELLKFQPALKGTPKRVRTVYGVIHLKLTQEQYNAIMSHGRVATFLDGGLLVVDTKRSGDYWSDLYESYPKCFVTDAH